MQYNLYTFAREELASKNNSLTSSHAV